MKKRQKDWKIEKEKQEENEEEHRNMVRNQEKEETWERPPILDLLVPCTYQTVQVFPGKEDSNKEDEVQEDLHHLVEEEERQDSPYVSEDIHHQELEDLFGEQPGRLCLHCVRIPCVYLLTLLNTKFEDAH